MNEMMQLVVGWSLVGGFAFTVAVTCLSLVGWVRFADPKQQRVLFQVVVVELLVAVGGLVLGFWRLDAGEVEQQLQRRGGNRALAGAVEQLLSAPATGATAPSKEQLLLLVERMEVAPGTREARQQQEFREAVQRLPASRIDADALRELRTIELPRPVRSP